MGREIATMIRYGDVDGTKFDVKADKDMQMPL